MEIIHLLVLFFAGMAVAFINTVSAAGSLVSLSAFMFCGLTSAEANATNRIPIIFQSYFSAKGFESKGVTGDAYKWWLMLATIPGAIAGAVLALNIPAVFFNRILIGVMLFFLVVTVVNPVNVTNEESERVTLKQKFTGCLIYFFVGIYGGFIQAGSGLFLMLPLLLINRFSIVKTNYYKVFVTLFFSLVALAVFIWKGNINWYYGSVMAVGSSLGGWMTSRWSVSLDERWMKNLMAGLIFLLAVYVWLFR